METDPVGPSPDAQAGRDVPAAEVPALEPARAARATGEVCSARRASRSAAAQRVD